MNELIFLFSGGVVGSFIMVFTPEASFIKRLVLLLEGVGFIVLAELSLEKLVAVASLTNGAITGFLVLIIMSFLFTTSTIEKIERG